MLSSRLQQALQRRQSQHKERNLPGSLQGIDFCSNDYLSLARSPEVHQRLQQYLHQETQLGATGSRLISGDRAAWQNIENRIADYHTAEAALVFGSGYQANVGLISALALQADMIYFDELVHASLREGIRLSDTSAQSFAHNDAADLARKLQQNKGQALVIVESIYSMDGDAAPLQAIALHCTQHQAALIVDEAHAVGIHGAAGGGMVPELQLEPSVFARIVTFGKALGAHGAAVLGSAILKQYLINYARPFIFTTGPAAHTWWHIQAAYDILAESQEARFALRQNILYFQKNLPLTLKEKFIPASGPIQSMLMPGNEAVMRVAHQLQKAGFAVVGIRHPSVPFGQERIRICLHAHNTYEEISMLLQTLQIIVKVPAC